MTKFQLEQIIHCFEQNLRISVLKQKNKYHHQIPYIQIRVVTRFPFLQIVLICGLNLPKFKKNLNNYHKWLMYLVNSKRFSNPSPLDILWKNGNEILLLKHAKNTNIVKTWKSFPKADHVTPHFNGNLTPIMVSPVLGSLPWSEKLVTHIYFW